ncbi:hypothetical protein A2U01_0022760, partial [Trifolium medium]|nr:hypothetical protein [Trifolium medium]
FEGCTIAGKKSDKVVSDDLLKDEIVSEQLTRDWQASSCGLRPGFYSY